MKRQRRRLTTLERAARAARRKQPQLHQHNPLLAPELVPGGSLAGWLTDEERERDRLERIAERWQEQQIRMRDLAEEQSERALIYRDYIVPVVGADELAQLDERAEFWAAKSAAYLAEYWYGVLRDHNQTEAQSFCHIDHERQAQWQARCPRCATPLEQAPKAVQMIIGEHDAPAIEDVIIGQIDREMRELALSSQEEEQGYFYSRYRELIAVV
jgi:hypothetical protein